MDSEGGPCAGQLAAALHVRLHGILQQTCVLGVVTPILMAGKEAVAQRRRVMSLVGHTVRGR